MTSVVVVVLVALAGCASSDDADKTAAASTQSGSLLPAAEGVTKYPLTLTTPWGETVLEKRPERIAAIAPRASDTELLATLGVTPVLAGSNAKKRWILDALPARIETTYEFSHDAPYPIEQIAASEPDLIIVIGGWEQVGGVFDKLAAIAPVLAGKDLKEFNGTWQEKLSIIAETLDLRAAAQAVIAGYDAKFANYRAENPKFAGKTVSFSTVYRGSSGTRYVSATGSDTEALFLQLGFARNPLAERFTNDQSVSNELLATLNADVVLVADVSHGEKIGNVVDSPLFRALGAVKRGHWALFTNTSTDTGEEAYKYNSVVYEGHLIWAVSTSGPLSSLWAAERLVPIIAGLLDK